MKNTTEEERNEMIQRMLEYCQRMLVAIEAMKNGLQSDESVRDAYDEIFIESKSEQRETKKHIARMVEHLLKLAYCDSELTLRSNRRQWMNHFRSSRNELILLLEWMENPGYTSLIRYAEKSINSAYSIGVTFYQNSSQMYPDLKDGVRLIPEKCPWSLKELMTNNVEELIKQLLNGLRGKA